MTGFNFNTAPQSVQSAGWETIDSGSFWPVVNLNDMRQAMRIDASVTSERLFDAAASAVSKVNRNLAELRKHAQAEGKAELAQLSDEKINGVSLPAMRYRRAVYCFTAALILETYSDTAATGKVADRADAKQQQADDFRREGHYAVADLIGRAHTDSELI